jgi:non-canonical (house-cleaning) NTP pyrophosphatase
MVAFAWMVILNNENTIGKAKTASFFLPEAINKMVSEGMELGEADDKLFRQRNSKENGGAVGILTNGVISRADYYQQALSLALIPFLKKEFY